MLHRRLPSFSLSKASKSDSPPPSTAAPPAPASSDERAPSRGRSLSPWGRNKTRDSSAEGINKDHGEETDAESDGASIVVPSNAFDTEDEEDDSDDGLSEPDAEDELLEKNTELNTSNKTPLEFLSADPTMTFQGEGPNLVAAADLPDPIRSPMRRRSIKVDKPAALHLHTSRPVYEKNRCTITLTHGDPEDAGRNRRRTRKYLVASDLSTESLYAIQWAIGTVLREGDECLIVSVMETDTKFDVEGPVLSAAEKRYKIVNQKDRQLSAAMLSRQATALLEKTRLNVRVVCQAIHAKNSRHMLLDMIDYLEPTMVIVGTRGLSQVKGMLLGSVSNYLLQRSSVPVMVTRRPLRLARTVHKRLSTLNRESRVPLAEAAIEKESRGAAIDADPAEPDDVAEEIGKLLIGHKHGPPTTAN